MLPSLLSQTPVSVRRKGVGVGGLCPACLGSWRPQRAVSSPLCLGVCGGDGYRPLGALCAFLLNRVLTDMVLGQKGVFCTIHLSLIPSMLFKSFILSFNNMHLSLSERMRLSRRTHTQHCSKSLIKRRERG